MLKIIAGKKGGIPLQAPDGMDTRPTQAKVRESLFNMIQNRVEGTSVLDLFAGSGALGFEALSRGAAEAVLNDQDRRAVECIRKNKEKLRFGNECEIFQGDWKAALSRLGGRRFDLVFLDPPYRMEILADCCGYMAEHGMLNPGALIIMEHASGRYTSPSGSFSEYKERAYGDTEIHIVEYEE